ncbi:MAG: hypothetical protein ACI9HK_002956 [Pirellulaceae bacterium]|jgi:hypothetical protein
MIQRHLLRDLLLLALLLLAPASAIVQAQQPTAFLKQHCYECHNADSLEGGLDLTAINVELTSADNFAKWVKVHDRIKAGEMPPKDQPRPPVADQDATAKWLKESLIAAERAARGMEPRTGVRRLTRAEYENTIRDLFDMSGIALRNELPADGSAHGFDKNSDALDISHVNLAKFLAAADHTLNLAIATQPQPPTSKTQRISLASQYIIRVVLQGGDCVMLKNKQPDPNFPPPGDRGHIGGLGPHGAMESYSNESTVGVFRHENESFNPYFQEFATIYPGRYRIRASFWSFGWDKGKVVPARGTEAARLSAVQLTSNGRGGGHPSYVLGYFAAPPNNERVHELITWLNVKETIGFNAASLAPVVNYSRKGRALAFTGPGIANDWLDVEGPLHDVWPPRSHQLLFGDLPLVEFKQDEQPGIRPPKRKPPRQEIIGSVNRVEQVAGTWSVKSEQPLIDADRLLAVFLPKAFRRPVSDDVRKGYVAKVEERIQAGDSFETAMRWVYQAALCSPDFLYLVESIDRLDEYALACRLSYFFWNSMPDDRLSQLAASNKLHEPDVLKSEVERLLRDPKSQRFVEDFLDQWLKLRLIAANDPDRKLYPEFNAYLQDSMVAETRAYFRELIDRDLNASHLVKSDFAMLNEKLAVHYGIADVSGPQIRRVALAKDSPRGGFLTQAAILKITANGTTTSPVPRGAFVLDRLLGSPPEPPPANVAAVEPDVQGATTIREQLAKHRDHAICASCHAKIDPPGFALETFDVIGGWRDRYRSIGDGDPAPRGLIDPFIGISFKLGPAVDSSGILPDGRGFKDIAEFQANIATDPRLLKNLAERLAVYSTGRALGFSDRDQISAILSSAQERGGGIRTLIHELVQSKLFQSR